MLSDYGYSLQDFGSYPDDEPEDDSALRRQCLDCRGSGEIDGEECRSCRGYGYIVEGMEDA